MTKPVLSISILSWNAADQVCACIESIVTQPLPWPYEIIIIDNASADDSVSRIQEQFPQTQYPQIRLIKNADNKKYAAGNNQALAVSDGDYFLLLNQDTVIPPGTLESLVNYLEKNPRYAGVTCQLRNTDGSIQYYMHRRFPTAKSLRLALMHKRWPRFKPAAARSYLYLDKSFQEDFDIEQAAGACLLLRRSTISQLGYLFDEERFPLYYNDVDLCYRLAQAKLPIRFLGNPYIMHHKGTSVRKLSWLNNGEYYVPASLQFFAKHHKTEDLKLLQRWYRLLFTSLLLITFNKLKRQRIKQVLTIIRSIG